MDQFRHVGEVLGSLKALMVMQDSIPINQKQCCLLLDIFSLTFNVISELIKTNLKLDEKNIKWKALEQPLKELYRVFKEGEAYVKHCMDNKDWLGKAMTYHQNKDCVEFHIHNLLCHFPSVVEAIETAGEISGLDEDEMERKRLILKKKYDDKDWTDPKLFGLRFGREYLVSKEMCYKIESACNEDRCLLLHALREMKNSELSKNEIRLVDMLIKRLNMNSNSNRSELKLSPSSVLLGSKDYVVRRRLGGTQLKEIHWLGEQLMLRQFYSEIESLSNERLDLTTLLSLSHPNILQCLCGFYDDEKREVYLVMEFMHKDVYNYMKENCGARRQLLFSIPVVVDILLQIARGMEYLHVRNIFHGDLNPTSVLLKPRYLTEGYFHVKVTGFGSSKMNNAHDNAEANNVVWLAPEVLAEQEHKGNKGDNNNGLKYSEKADVYSFGMLAFDLLTGKIPFEDGYLPGDKSCKNIRAGGRPLFPFTTPKYLVSLTKKCWHSDPTQRPSFGSVCRILRYIKRFLVMNPVSEEGQPQLQVPAVEYVEIEAGFGKRFGRDQKRCDLSSVTQIPFQIFSYRVLEKTRIGSGKNGFEFESDEDPMIQDGDLRSVCSEVADRRAFATADTRSVCSEAQDNKAFSLIKVKDLSMEDKPGISDGSDASTSKKTHLTPVLPEIPETKSSSPGRDSKSSRKKALQSKDTSSISSVSPRKKSLLDTLTRSSSDMNPRSAHSQPPLRKKGVGMSISSDALDRNALSTTFKERRARPEGTIKNKRMLSLKMTKNVKLRQGLDSSKSSTWNPCGRSVKIGRDTKPNSVASPKKRSVSGSGSGSTETAETS